MRIIARLDIKLNILIKSIMYDGVRKIGDPIEFARDYYNSGIDELLLVNNTGSLYNTRLDKDFIKKLRKDKALPITAGGGISSISDAMDLIESGCDKVVINTLIHKNPSETKKIIDLLGSSSVVGAIQVDRRDDKHITLCEMARDLTGLTLKETLKKYSDLGIGEVLVTDIYRDGCYTGLNENLIEELIDFKKIFPILISGGFIDKQQIKNFSKIVSGIVISSAFHYKKLDIAELVKYKNISLK